MEINKILFEQLNMGKVEEAFEDLDINGDGAISEADLSQTENVQLKEAITTILNSIDKEDNIEVVETAPTLTKAAASSSSARQNSKDGIPMTDANTFKDDVLKSMGTVYVLIDGQFFCGDIIHKVEQNIAAKLPEVQKHANVYHLDVVNSELISDLTKQLGMKHYSSLDLPMFLKFVDGKLVGQEKLNGLTAADTIINNSVGTPSQMPDVPAAVDTNPNAPKNRYGVKTTNTANFQNDVLNSKGTVYVTIGNLSNCAYCAELQQAIQYNAQTLNAVATVYDLSTDTDKDLCWQIFRDMGGNKENTMPLPQIAKFVDGKFVQIMSGRMAPDAVSKMLKLAEGRAKKDKDGIAQTSAATFNDDVKNSKGTTYVMITSASGCQYCNILHNRMKDVLSQVQDKFGFYELATNEGADRDLCWQIYRDMGGGDGTKAMNLPQIAKFVDGKFVELLSTTRDYGEGLDNAVIKEMLEKAVGKPENNAMNTSSASSTDSSSASMTKATASNSDKSKYEAEKALQEENLAKLNAELENIESEQAFKNMRKTIQENELKEKQAKYDELDKKLKNAADGEDTSSVQSEMQSLKGRILSLSSGIRILEQDISSLNTKSLSKLSAISVQEKSIAALEEKLAE
ncbi:MAG: hypothetical protein K6A44_04165 [bacterium]|nr:hypothetical protein [bacterium]